MGILKSRIGRVLLIVAGVCLWLYFVCRFPAVSLFTLLVPPIIAVNFSRNLRLRNATISIFVVLWLFIFHYESTRIFYLNAATQSELPKFKFLFPPAGWIMFFMSMIRIVMSKFTEKWGRAFIRSILTISFVRVHSGSIISIVTF